MLSVKVELFFAAHLHTPRVSAGQRLQGGDFKGRRTNANFALAVFGNFTAERIEDADDR